MKLSRYSLPFFMIFQLNIAFAQNFQEVEKLNSLNRQFIAGFGESVSISGNYAIVGAPFDSLEGAVFFFEKTDGVWKEVQKIVDMDSVSTFDNFGIKVSISGSHAIVGAPYDVGPHVGAVYFLERSNAGIWEIVQKVDNPSVGSDWVGSFGWSVAIDGDYAIVGLFGVPGAAFIYERDEEGEWIEAKYIYQPEDFAFDYGWQVAISGEQAMVAAKGEDPGGAVYVLERSDTTDTWALHQKIENPAALSYGFGGNLAMSSDYAIVSTDSEPTGDHCSAVSFLEKIDSTLWQVVQRIDGCELEQDSVSRFGKDGMDIDGNTALVGSTSNNANGLNGAVYVIRRTGSGLWEVEQEIQESSLGAADRLGTSVGLDGDCAIFGAPNAADMVNDVPLDGVAYIYCTSVSNTVDGAHASVKVDVSPNPASVHLHLRFHHSNDEMVYLSLYNAQGNLMHQEAQFSPAGANDRSIDVTKLAKGFYFIRLQGEGWFAVEPVAVQ